MSTAFSQTEPGVNSPPKKEERRHVVMDKSRQFLKLATQSEIDLEKQKAAIKAAKKAAAKRRRLSRLRKYV